MQESRRIRILIADDHPVVRQGLAAVIDREPDMVVVGQAKTGEQAVALYEELRPDITLMDLRLPAMGGVEATVSIRAKSPVARIIVLTSFEGDEDIYRALRAGAQGYLLKGMPLEEVFEAIRAVNTGQKRIPAVVAGRLAERAILETLSTREIQALKLVVKGLSNKQIAAAMEITEATVKSHLTSIMQKMGVSDRTEAAIAAVQRGIVMLE
ncbi:MAG: response regulator transcription factor [Acidobacteria bacterium]|nr:response regulator transcription factor [Acidobacteriota bacterium]